MDGERRTRGNLRLWLCWGPGERRQRQQQQSTWKTMEIKRVAVPNWTEEGQKKKNCRDARTFWTHPEKRQGGHFEAEMAKEVKGTDVRCLHSTYNFKMAAAYESILPPQFHCDFPFEIRLSLRGLLPRLRPFATKPKELQQFDGSVSIYLLISSPVLQIYCFYSGEQFPNFQQGRQFFFFPDRKPSKTVKR